MPTLEVAKVVGPLGRVKALVSDKETESKVKRESMLEDWEIGLMMRDLEGSGRLFIMLWRARSSHTMIGKAPIAVCHGDPIVEGQVDG